ncbi:hypothetical protein Q5692_38435 [Microcoleus sp. C2C3]|uniref:hypothetical protein n=1 Tax=unclassified Microcoleus TaxID=2642155 RepID=UPI002FD58517
MSLVYEETYKDQSIEIYCFSQFAPGGVGSSYFWAIINDYRLPGNFDGRSHNPFCPSENTGNPRTPKQSSALAAAKAYCDRRVKQASNARTNCFPSPYSTGKLKPCCTNFSLRW